MKSVNIYQKLKGLKLERNSDHYLTTGDKEVDHLYGLDNATFYGNIESNAQANFAALVYLNGLFGGKCTHFTACPVGFLYEMDYNGERGCYIASEADLNVEGNNALRFAIDELISQIKNYMKSNELTEDEIAFCNDLIADLESCDGVSLLKIVQNVSAVVNSNDKLGRFKGNAEEAKVVFDKTNQTNCDENHIIFHYLILKREDELYSIITHEKEILRRNLEALGINPNLSIDQIKKELEKVDEKDREIVLKSIEKIFFLENYSLMNFDELMTWVGTGYLMHRGFDREGKPIINKDRNILNSRAEAGSEVEEVFGEDTKTILNICVTDYLADRVYDVIDVCSKNTQKHQESNEFERQVNEITETVDNNRYSKNQARRKINSRHGHYSLEK